MRCVSHVPYHLARTDGCMDNSCKRRTYCLYRSFVIVHTECGQCQASLTWEKSVCLAEVSVTADFTEIPRNPGGTEHAQIVCTRLFFLRLRTRAWERGYDSRNVNELIVKMVVHLRFFHIRKQVFTKGYKMPAPLCK